MFLFLFFSMLLLCSFFRLKELFQVKNGLTTSLLFFLKMTKIWVGQTTLNGEKKRNGIKERFFIPRLIFPFTWFIPLCSFPTLKNCRRVSGLCLLP